MRAPRQYVDCQNNHIQTYQVRVERANSVFKKEYAYLNNAKRRYAEQRTERAPFRKENKEHDPPQQHENDKDKPRIFARERKPEQAERRGDTLTALKLACDGKDVSDDDEQTAEIANKIGRKRFRTAKIGVAVDKKADKRRDAAFKSVAKEGDKTDF